MVTARGAARVQSIVSIVKFPYISFWTLWLWHEAAAGVKNPGSHQLSLWQLNSMSHFDTLLPCCSQSYCQVGMGAPQVSLQSSTIAPCSWSSRVIQASVEAKRCKERCQTQRGITSTHFVVSPQFHQDVVEDNWYLVDIDVESLYTSIPHYWGLKAVKFFLYKFYTEMAHQNKFILDLLDFALYNSFFHILHRHILPTGVRHIYGLMLHCTGNQFKVFFVSPEGDASWQNQYVQCHPFLSLLSSK